MDTFVCCSVHMKTPETLAKRRRKEFFRYGRRRRRRAYTHFYFICILQWMRECDIHTQLHSAYTHAADS